MRAGQCAQLVRLPDVERVARHVSPFSEAGARDTGFGCVRARTATPYLLHDARLSLAEGDVPPIPVLDKLNVDFSPKVVRLVVDSDAAAAATAAAGAPGPVAAQASVRVGADQAAVVQAAVVVIVVFQIVVVPHRPKAVSLIATAAAAAVVPLVVVVSCTAPSLQL